MKTKLILFLIFAATPLYFLVSLGMSLRTAAGL
jgi:hypothetical protein